VSNEQELGTKSLETVPEMGGGKEEGSVFRGVKKKKIGTPKGEGAGESTENQARKKGQRLLRKVYQGALFL